MNSWEIKPDDPEESCEVAKRQLEKAPKLIPTNGHRYIPDSLSEVGNPIFSVYKQT